MPAVVVVQVDDTTRALQRLAKHIRRASGAQVVAITGSAGKTTTKEIDGRLLDARYRVFRNHGNFNNHIGLPLSLLELRHGPEIAVVELGMNHAGEIRLLVDLAEPDVRVWTMVAEVHSAFFASIEAIADAKAEILEGATPRSLVVANAADPLVMARVAASPARVRDVRHRRARRRRAPRRSSTCGLAGTRATVTTPWGTAVVGVPLLGRGHLGNALAAMAVAGGYGVPLERDGGAHRGDQARRAAGRGVAPPVGRHAGRRLVQLESARAAVHARGGGRRARVREARRRARRDARTGRAGGGAARGLRPRGGAGGLAHLVTVGGAAARAMAEAAVAAGMPAAAVRHVGDQRRGGGHRRAAAPRRRRRAGEGIARRPHRHRGGPGEGSRGMSLAAVVESGTRRRQGGMSEFTVRGKRVVVVGGAASGVAAARLLVGRGAAVTLTDLRPALDARGGSRRASACRWRSDRIPSAC